MAQNTPSPPRVGFGIGAIALLIALGAVLALIFVFRYVDDERERALRGWQDRLGLVADSRAAAVRDWLAEQNEVLTGLAGNTALQLYVTELAMVGGQRSQVTEEAAQAGYLRNLLIVVAERAGFTGSATGPRVDAGVARSGVAGIALLDPQGNLLVATPEMPALTGRLGEFVTASVPAAQNAILDVYAGSGSQPSMGFFIPIISGQLGLGTPPVGFVLGVKEIARELYPLLRRPPLVEKSAETVLVRRAGASIEFLSPLADGTAPLQRRLAADSPNLAEAFALATPGGFAIRRDYRDQEVLAISRAIEGVPWALVHKVDRAEALADSDSRLNSLLIVLVLVILALVGALATVWRHGASRRASEAAARYQTLAGKFEQQSDLLRRITDSQSASIFIIGSDGRLTFANQALESQRQVGTGDLNGKSLVEVFGPAEAKRYERADRTVLEAGERKSFLHRDENPEGAQKLRVVKSEHIPLPYEGVKLGEGRPAPILVVEEDVTAVVAERERRERTQKELVRSLMTVLDRRDPFAANQSARVATVAKRIAEEMGLGAVEIETAETAGSLVNLGKILVPPELLTKTGALTDAERKLIADSMAAGSDLISRVEFEGPVADTLRQVHERWDGTGKPDGRAAEAILVSARVVAVANAFVALVSPRAWRAGVDFDNALDALQRDAGKAYDRRVVTALANIIENRGGRTAWAEFAEPKAAE
jgi:HD-GYP domain-containing protein (c-di-GMP phosphodiesterase class II)